MNFVCAGVFSLLFLFISNLTSNALAHSQFDFDGIVVVSDIHVLYGVTEDENRRTFERFMDFVATQEKVTDVIVNGDLYHAPSVAHLPEEKRVALAIEMLLEIQAKTGKRVHFNLGNHEEYLVRGPRGLTVDREYSRRLAKAVKEAGFPVIGTNPREVYEYRVAGLDLLISHSPFIKTRRTEAQSHRFSDKEGPINKVVRSVPRLEAMQDRFIRVMGDSHTPLIDPILKVFNAGKLAFDPTLPEEEKTFLSISANGRGRILSIPPSRPIRPFMSCGLGFLL